MLICLSSLEEKTAQWLQFFVPCGYAPNPQRSWFFLVSPITNHSPKKIFLDTYRANWWVMASLVFLLSSQVCAENVKEYEFLVNQNTLLDYEELLQGREPLEIKNVDGATINRHAMELFIFQIAPVVGGCHCRIKYTANSIATPHAREIVMVGKGAVISHPISAMGSDARLQNDYLLSESILDANDFYVGLYTDENRSDILALEDPEAIEKLRFAVVHHWKTDRDLIENRGFPMIETDDWDSLLKMITASRADVILQPFSKEPDLSFTDSVLLKKFKPIPGFKLRFGQSRRYFVSAKHPDGENFLTALNKGITELKESGMLKSLQYQSGVINPQVEKWSTF